MVTANTQNNLGQETLSLFTNNGLLHQLIDIHCPPFIIKRFIAKRFIPNDILSQTIFYPKRYCRIARLGFYCSTRSAEIDISRRRIS
jgi:hypothetical protein